MSLVAWYPLNGDYKNYTAENMGLTQTSTPSYENGKIGRALSLGGFKWTAEQTAKILNNKEVSIALWIYVNADEGSTTNRAMIFGNDNMLPPNNRRFSLYQYPNCNSLHWSWQNGNSSDTFTAGVLNGVFPSYKWTHICVTYKNPIGKIYINGELKKTFNGVYNSESFEYETQVIHNSSYHYLNDYRFYNHCLSDAEVKEISKGLVLHYTMDKVYEENKVYDSSGFGNDGTPTDLEYSIDRKKGLTSTKYNGSTSRILTQKGSFSWFNFDECTISCWMKPTVSPSGYTGSVGVSYDESINPEIISGRSLSLNNHNGLLCIESIKDNQWKTYNSEYPLVVNEWQHCAVTLNKNNFISFYVNGILVKTDILDFGSNISQNQNAFFQVGCDLAGGDEYYQGYYDDVRFYTTSLSADDILQLYKETQKIDNKGNLYCSELNEVERRVEYLESNGTQWIDTGIIPDPSTIRVNTIMSTNGDIYENSGGYSLFGMWDSFNFRIFKASNVPESGMLRVQLGGKSTNISGISLDNSKLDINFSHNSLYINNIEKNIDVGNNTQSAQPIYIFASKSTTSSIPEWLDYSCNIRCYQFKIWNNNILVRDFLPVISTEEGHIGEACLFDTVTNTYFYNQGTGKFITNLDESTTNIDFTSKGIVNTDYIIEGKDKTKILNDGNIIEVNNLYEN